jgi:hypothetical protein
MWNDSRVLHKDTEADLAAHVVHAMHELGTYIEGSICLGRS